MELEPQQAIGRPTLASKEVAGQILRYLAQGNYLKPSCEAAGVSYQAVRQWIARAAEERRQGLTSSPYIDFVDRFSRAEAAGETALVERLNTAEDWRAQAFILERRHRERWGKAEQQQQPQQVLIISDELAKGMLEALQAAAAVGQISNVMSTSDAAQQETSVEAEFTQLPSKE